MNEYKDTDFVYVNPKTREIVGHVQWSDEGMAIGLSADKDEDGIERSGKKRGIKKDRKCYHPWGTVRSMKNFFRIGGRHKEENANHSLDAALEKAIREPFWD